LIHSGVKYNGRGKSDRRENTDMRIVGGTGGTPPEPIAGK
jgi:hypothetical protein